MLWHICSSLTTSVKSSILSTEWTGMRVELQLMGFMTYLLCKAGHHFPGRQNLSYHVVCICVCARYTVGGVILQTKANDKKKQLKSLHLYATSKYANYKLEVYQNTSNVSAGHYFKLTSSSSLNYHHLQKCKQLKRVGTNTLKDYKS